MVLFTKDGSGSWFEYEGNKIAQGRDSAKEYIKSNEDVKEKLLAQLKEAKEAQD